MNDFVAAALLGAIQGLTEFLPVSSTAHLALAERVFGLEGGRFGLTFDVALHMGTLLAVLLYFAATWLGLLRDVLAGRWRTAAALAIGTVPAVIAGLLLESAVEHELRNPLIIAAALAGGGLVFVLAERIGRARSDKHPFGISDALFMGTAQAIALIPGVSRSGITISAGLLRGLERADATRASFLLATPVMAGAGAKRLLDAGQTGAALPDASVVAVGFLVAFVAGLLAIAFLMRFLRRNALTWFVPYRLALAAAIVAATLAGLL